MQNSNTKTYVTKSCAVVDNGRDAVLNATRMIYKTVYKDGTDQSMGIGAISISRTDILSTPRVIAYIHEQSQQIWRMPHLLEASVG